MNRGDARLFLTIISTAISAALITVIVSREVGSRGDPSVPVLEQRVGGLEHRVSELEHARVRIEPIVPTVAQIQTPPPDPAPCDEVACILDNYEPVCCKRFDHRNDGTSDGTSLDRAAILAGIARIKPQLVKCGDLSAAKGQVKVSVKVAPAGSVSGVVVKTSPEPRLGKCVAMAFSHATFATTDVGGSFGYPVVY